MHDFPLTRVFFGPKYRVKGAVPVQVIFNEIDTLFFPINQETICRSHKK